MIDVIPINLAVEDELSEVVLRQILSQSSLPYAIGTCYSRHGFGFLKKNIGGFNNAAKGTPFIVLTDLDKWECPPELVKQWLSVPIHPNLIFRIAERQTEAWILAHRSEFARFLGISINLMPMNPDEIENSKRHLIELASKSRYRLTRQAIVPGEKSTAKIGPDYNGALSSFIQTKWSVDEAIKCSPSLARTYKKIKSFRPIYSS